MKNLNLISSIEAHLLVNKAIDCTLQSLKESQLESIREAASYWERKLDDFNKAPESIRMTEHPQDMDTESIDTPKENVIIKE